MGKKIGEQITIIDWENTRLPKAGETISFNKYQMVEQQGNRTIIITTINDEEIRCSSKVVANQLLDLANSYAGKGDKLKELQVNEVIHLPETIEAKFEQREPKHKKEGYSDYWILV